MVMTSDCNVQFHSDVLLFFLFSTTKWSLYLRFVGFGLCKLNDLSNGAPVGKQHHLVQEISFLINIWYYSDACHEERSNEHLVLELKGNITVLYKCIINMEIIFGVFYDAGVKRLESLR